MADDSGRLGDESTKRPCIGTPPVRPRRALIVFPGALGDLLLLAPGVATLASAGTQVELSVNHGLRELAGTLLGCRLGPPADGRAMSSVFGRLDPEIAEWWTGADRLDVWFGAHGAEHVARHACALGVVDARSHAVERNDASGHASESYAAALGVEPPLLIPTLRVGETSRCNIGNVPRDRRLVVHPGAGSRHKRWSDAAFAAVADAWRREQDGEAIVLLGPAETGEVDAWRARGLRVESGLSVLDSATLLASATCFVGNDSGVSHLAAATRVRGVVLFGPTRPERWCPLGGSLSPVAFHGRDDDEVIGDVARALDDARRLVIRQLTLTPY